MGDASLLKYETLKEVLILGEDMGTLQLNFSTNVSLKCKCENSQDRQKLLDMIAQHSMSGKAQPYVHAYDSTVVGAWKDFMHEMKDGGCFGKLLAIPEFLLDFVLKGTLSCVDVKDIRKEGRWAACFMGAMFWLAMFSWAMLAIADQIHYNIPVLPTSFLGITVCA